MVFTSNLFLFLFLPVFLAVYYLIPFAGRSVWILLASYVFYGWWRPDFALLLGGVTLGTYLLTRGMVAADEARSKKRWMAAGVLGNLAALGYFKYFNFGMDSLNTALGWVGAEPLGYAHVVLPIGLSFFIFQAISYQVDVYRGDAPVTRNVADFAAFISFFPQLVAGPVLRYQPLADQFYQRRHSWPVFTEGCLIFMAGFCAKVLIADPMAPLVDAAFALKDPGLLDAWLGAAAYTVQLFFDFSGYSTMAIGLGLMIGFHFPKNFDDPYISASITEFWRRWHMSLSTWLRVYLYVPLGGNRLGRGRTYFNLLATMVLGGMWHGANWTFIIWGCWHGGLLALERWWRESHPTPRLPHALAVAWTLLLVMIGWVWFRAADVGAALHMLRAMAGLQGWGTDLSPALAWQVAPERVAMLIFGALFALALPWLRPRFHGGWRLALVPLFLWGVATLSAQAFTPFLYFQF